MLAIPIRYRRICNRGQSSGADPGRIWIDGPRVRLNTEINAAVEEFDVYRIPQQGNTSLDAPESGNTNAFALDEPVTQAADLPPNSSTPLRTFNDTSGDPLPDPVVPWVREGIQANGLTRYRLGTVAYSDLNQNGQVVLMHSAENRTFEYQYSSTTSGESFLETVILNRGTPGEITFRFNADTQTWTSTDSTRAGYQVSVDQSNGSLIDLRVTTALFAVCRRPR